MGLLCCLPTCLTYVAGVVGGIWLLANARILPAPVLRAWFIGVLIVCILSMAAGCVFADAFRFIGVPRKFTQLICGLICTFWFWLACFLNPHIKMTMDESALPGGLKAISSPAAMALNHTSFWDVFAFIANSPWSYIYNVRTLMKSSLRKIPIFGSVFDRVGHYPVYFKSNEDGNFSVDKERQAPVMAKVDAHLKNGGRIALFPEGAVNKNPETLATFRRGSFAVIAEHKLPVYWWVTYGNNKTWGALEAVGGHSADIQIAVGEYKIDWNNAEEADPLNIANGLQKVMQEKLDELKAKANKKNQ